MSSGLPPPEQNLSKTGLTEGQVQAIDEQRGATVHTFDPNASTAEKAAEAGNVAHLNDHQGYHGLGDAKKTGGAQSLKIDTSNAPTPVPTVSISDIDKTSRAEGQGKDGETVSVAEPETKTLAGAEGVPGAITTPPANEIPDWYKIGWRQVSGVDGVPGDGTVLAERLILAEWMTEQAYGTWWQNAGVIFFAVSASHLLAVLRLGLGWTAILLAVCASYYTVSITRVRRAARDDIQRELVKTRLITEHESADWINNFLNRFWKIYEPVLSATIVASVDNVLSTSTPAFLESIKMTTFTLGTKAPRIDSVRTHPKTADDVVVMDWKLSFTPTDLSDVTPREQQFQTNPKIVLEVKIGKGFISAPMPILLEDMSFTGNMRIKLKLMNNFPHVQLVEMSFLEKPYFDYVLKPLGGETLGFDIASIPGLSGFIRDMVHGILGPMMYDPNVFTLNLESLLSGAPLDTAIGVLEVKLDSARGIKSTKLGGGAPDPYVSVAIAGKQEVARTKTKSSTYNPQWSETEYILVSSLTDVLALTVMDFNDHRKDTELGISNFEMSVLAEDATQDNLKLPILKGGKTMGELRAEINFYPVLTPKKLSDGTLDAVPETRSGICRLTIHQAKDLDASRLLGIGGGGVNPYAKLFIGGQKEPAFKTGVFKNNFQPSWESSYEFIVPDKDSSTVTVRVIDDRDFAKDPLLGYVTVSLQDLLTAKDRQQDWFPLSRAKTGRVRLTAEWKPLDLPGSVNGAGAYTAPIGILRILLKKAVDVKNVEALLGGKSDPYVRVLSHGNTLARSEVVNNNLNPEWDQYVYVPVHSINDRPILEVMDYQHLTKDRSLGSVEIHVNEFAVSTSDKRTPYASNGVHARSDGIRIDGKNTVKGQLHFDVEFCPAVNLKGGVSFHSKDAGPLAADGSSSALSLASPTSPAGDQVTANQDESSGVELSREKLLATPSALLVIQAISGKMEKRARLEVLLDDGYWPSFGTAKARSHHATWDQVGEAFVKELPLSRVCLRLNANDEEEKEDIVAEIRMDTRLLVEQCLDSSKEFTLLAPDGSGRKSTVLLSARLVPVDIVISPRESANNMGILQIEIVDGGDLRAADRSGKSDPYAVLTLNGEKVFKTKEIRKTLAPTWNESFEANIPSRVGAKFDIEVFDYNKVEQAKTLGVGRINLADLEPFEVAEQRVSLTSKEGVKGWVRVRLVFQPAIIAKSRKNTSTFSTAGRAMTMVGHAPIGVVGAAGKGAFKGVGMVGHGVGHVGNFAGRKIGLVKKRDKSGNEVLVEEEIVEEPSIGTGSNPTVHSTDFAAAGSPQEGALTVTVLSARDLAEEAKVEVAVTAGSKTHKTKHSHKSVTPEWNDDLHYTLTPEISSLNIQLYEHKSLGKDKTLGSAEVDIWRYVSPAVSSADVEVPIQGGQGILRLKLAFRPQGGPSQPSTVPSSPIINGSHLLNQASNGSRTSLVMSSPAKGSRKSISGDSPGGSKFFGRRKDKE